MNAAMMLLATILSTVTTIHLVRAADDGSNLHTQPLIFKGGKSYIRLNGNRDYLLDTTTSGIVQYCDEDKLNESGLSCPDECSFKGFTCTKDKMCFFKSNAVDELPNTKPIDAIEVTENVLFPGDNLYVPKLNVGCMKGSDKEENSGGIFGIGKAHSHFLSAIKTSSRVQDTFIALCLDQQGGGGFMTIGAVDTRLHKNPMVYALNWGANQDRFVVKAKFLYLTNLTNGAIAGISRNTNTLNKGSSGIILSTGSRHTHFDITWKKMFISAWNKFMPQLPFDMTFSETKVKQLGGFNALPTILLQVQGYHSEEFSPEDPKSIETLAAKIDVANPLDVLIRIQPTHYLQYDHASKNYIFNIEFSNNIHHGAILGHDVLQGHNVLYSLEEKKPFLGIAEVNGADCSKDLVPYIKSKDIGSEILDKEQEAKVIDLGKIDCELGKPQQLSSCEDNVTEHQKLGCQKINSTLNSKESWRAVVKNVPDGGQTCEEIITAFHLSGNVVDSSIVCDDKKGWCEVTQPCTTTCGDLENDQNHASKSGEKVFNDDDNDYNLYGDDDFDIIAKDDLDCNPAPYGACTASCLQTKLVSKLDKVGGKCVEQDPVTRICHTGACVRDEPCKIPYRVHSVFLLKDASSTEKWDELTKETFAVEVARLLDGVGGGDVQVLMASTKNGECTVVIEINVFVEDNLKCESHKMSKAASFSASLHAVLNNPSYATRLLNNLHHNSDYFVDYTSLVTVRTWTINTDLNADPSVLSSLNSTLRNPKETTILFLLMIFVASMSLVVGRKWEASINAARVLKREGKSLMISLKNRLSNDPKNEGRFGKYSSIPTGGNAWARRKPRFTGIGRKKMTNQPDIPLDEYDVEEDTSSILN